MVFIETKYSKWYYSIIAAAKARSTTLDYTEKHHIIPKSLGGTNLSKNLVSLSAREHFICHWLLLKMTVGMHRSKMACAFWRMTNTVDKYHFTSKTYELARANFISTKIGIPLSPETKEKISLSQKGLPRPNDPWNKGITGYSIHTDESKDKIRQAQSRPNIEKFGKEKADNIIRCQRERMAGKSHEEIYGDKSALIKEQIRTKLKGRTLEEILGPERAAAGRAKRRETMLKRNAEKK